VRTRDVASVVSKILDVLVWVLAIAAFVALGLYLRARYAP